MLIKKEKASSIVKCRPDDDVSGLWVENVARPDKHCACAGWQRKRLIRLADD
ncbi:hypothetical protein A464_3583 [Salmonella bongori N268-08]|uniref:Uncharacterized protein n=1 Tax=Salmonella bongori N268-08 TaxID=1197719 RepID=S5NKF9_SALBN|nr:hypothetical protein A464_3583 [Salmonella bongori N268-08]